MHRSPGPRTGGKTVWAETEPGADITSHPSARERLHKAAVSREADGREMTQLDPFIDLLPPITGNQAEDRMIRDHIAKNGVTRCPTAFAAPCSADVNPLDAAVHTTRGDVIGDLWRAKDDRGRQSAHNVNRRHWLGKMGSGSSSKRKAKAPL